jgi:hypothetical protein
LKALCALPFVSADIIADDVKSTGSSVTAGIASYQYRIGNTSTSVSVPGESFAELMKTFVGFTYPMSSVGIPYANYSSATATAVAGGAAADASGYGGLAIGLSCEAFKPGLSSTEEILTH